MVHRMSADEKHPYLALGFTADEERQYTVMMTALYERLCNKEVVNGAPTRNTITKTIHDQITANHF